MTVDELVQQFVGIRTKMEAGAAEAASTAMAERGSEIVRALLSRPGRSLPGEPPGMQSGELRSSIRVVPGTPGEISRASVSPHTVYARIQEFGGEIWPSRRKYLSWIDTSAFGHGGRVYAKRVHLPERSYMRKMREIGIADGSFKAAARRAFDDVTGL